MKIALVITDGLRNVTLTPETDEETSLLEVLHKQDWNLTIMRGQFFICRGDYPRFGTWPGAAGTYGEKDSTMLILRPKPKPVEQPA